MVLCTKTVQIFSLNRIIKVPFISSSCKKGNEASKNCFMEEKKSQLKGIVISSFIFHISYLLF